MKHLAFVTTVISLMGATDARASECDLAGAHPEWVFCHDFEAPDSSDIGAYWNDTYGAPERVFLIDDNPAGVDGSHSLRMQVVNDTDSELSSGVTSGPKKFLGETVDWNELYYRRYVRFNADFHQGNFMHLGGMGACHPSLYPWDCMGGAGIRPSGDDRFSSNLEPWSDYQSLPWPGRWGFYSYYHQMYMDCHPAGSDNCWGDMFSPDPDAFITRGDWHVLEMMIDPGTPGAADGSQTFWIDGVIQYTAIGIAWRTTDELRINKIGVYLYIHNNPAFTTNILDADNVVISRGYIGPAPCQIDVGIGAPCVCGGEADPDDASNVVASGYCCGEQWQAGRCGPIADAGATPGGEPDAGPLAPDAGQPPPGGGSDDEQDALTSGCAALGARSGPGAPVLLLVTATLLRRRRARP